ncbi:MAG: class I SAM-dependent methyltransferase [Candidatus Binatia bacterium]
MVTDRLEAREETSVKALYQDERVAETYLQQRFTSAWGRLLHERQVKILNHVIASRRIRSALELAPGPARLAAELREIETGVMIDDSEPMIAIARRRLREANLLGVWQVRHGSAFDLGGVDRRFDLVFTFRFIRHFERAERQRLYRQIAERMSPEGLLVFDVVDRPVRERIDANRTADPSELSVYDALHTEEELRREMRASGFAVLELHGVVRHFGLQAAVSHRLGARLPRLADIFVRLAERVPSRSPLEWVCVCRKTSAAATRTS